ncbi:Flp pilus assembly protein CpaB [Tritonibacter multivorans]|uniref:Flp pilus assembly protein CpaB n=1 Tax=Tritonibacter multivorans TaxID=928856 RepID=UPI0010417A31|nr:Flp pilus assembly protein CpaB [Tritonibacter multivorans]MDA7422457.1 Flp pilus assembly protein CpaB [Tritonibacter multivorans]
MRPLINSGLPMEFTMRFSVFFSFIIAALFAAGAVFGARAWLDAERRELLMGILPEQTETVPTETVVVATGGIGFGERLTQRKLREIPWSGDIRPEGSFEKIAEVLLDGTESKARFALTSIAVGEPLLATKVTEPGVRAKLSTALSPGLKAVSIRVNDVLGVAGFVLPGDRVDILLTRDDFVDVLLQGVKVLAIDQIADDRKDKPSVVRTVTFEVGTQEAQKLTLGAQVGVLSLALRNLSSDELEDNIRITKEDLSDFDVADGLPSLKTAKADPNAERVADLEKQLEDMAGLLAKQMRTIEEKLERKPLPTPARGVSSGKARPTFDPSAKIGVIRNGNREEYRVDVPRPTAIEEEHAMKTSGSALLASWASLLAAQHTLKE